MLTLLSQEKSLFSVASTELQALKNAIVQYQIKTKPDPQTVIDLNVNNCTWNNVQEAVKVAAREEGSDDESSIARTCCSTIIANLPAFETWLDLLPSGDYGAVVCGLFKMVVVVNTQFHLVASFCLILTGCETCKRSPRCRFQSPSKYTGEHSKSSRVPGAVR